LGKITTMVGKIKCDRPNLARADHGDDKSVETQMKK
jgi:hypothetical protein